MQYDLSVLLFVLIQYGQNIMCIRVLLLTIVAMTVGLVSPAHAYLDPGTGSIILQGIIGGVAAGAAVIGIYWQKVKAMFSSEKPPLEDPPSAEQHSQE